MNAKTVQANGNTDQKEESFAVATIFDKTGSAPRTAGAKMVVRASTAGTIGEDAWKRRL